MKNKEQLDYLKSLNNDTFSVVEIFRSIQGEGLNSGRAAVFIRLAGCNLSCPWCDEPLHGNPSKATEMTARTIWARYKELSMWNTDTLAIITGGEPTILGENKTIDLLTSPYKPYDVKICVETNGFDVSCLKYYDFVAYSPKVLTDYDPALKYATECRIPFKKGDGALLNRYRKNQFCRARSEVTYFVTPINDELSLNIENNEAAMEFVLANPSWRLNVQTHKILGVR